MDWNKTKSLFIIVFLILDIFLLVQVYNQSEEKRLDKLKNSTGEERLKAANISWDSDTISSEKITGQYVSAKTKMFTNKELKGLKNQTASLVSPTKINSIFTKPIKVKDGLDQVQMKNILKTYVMYGEQYDFWRYDEKSNAVIFYQTYENKQFFKNKNGQVILYLNDKKEVTSYEQTILEDINKIEEKDVLPAVDNLAALYDKGFLKRNSKVLSVDLGYFTLIPETETQMLVPTRHFVVKHDDEQEDFYVNAIEGKVFPVDTQENQILE